MKAWKVWLEGKSSPVHMDGTLSLNDKDVFTCEGDPTATPMEIVIIPRERVLMIESEIDGAGIATGSYYRKWE